MVNVGVSMSRPSIRMLCGALAIFPPDLDTTWVGRSLRRGNNPAVTEPGCWTPSGPDPDPPDDLVMITSSAGRVVITR
jgi:hypothetical protein